MKKPVIMSNTVTVPASSEVWGIGLVLTPNPPGTLLAPTPQPPSSSAQQAVAKDALPIKYAGAVVTGQEDVLAFIAQCFDCESARITKHKIKGQEESWVLESSEFAQCTAGEQVFPIADDIVSRFHHILALYGNYVPVIEVEYINWVNAEGEPKRTLRSSASLNIVSSKGQAELKGMRGTQPLGSAVFEAIARDPAIKDALSLHGDGALSWSQVYDIIEFLGGEDRIVKAGYATRKQTRAARQTANHHRHTGSPKKAPLPPTPPTLEHAGEFARSLLRQWISERL